MSSIYRAVFIAAVWATATQAKVHRLFASNRNSPPEIHSMEFDDEDGTLELVKSMKADSSYMWTSFSVRPQQPRFSH